MLKNVIVKEFPLGQSVIKVLKTPIIVKTDEEKLKTKEKYEAGLEEKKRVKDAYKIIEDLFPTDSVYTVKSKEDIIKEIHSLNSSISRTKHAISDYCMSNKWDYFFTFTGNKDYIDRYNYDKMKAYVNKWCNNTRSKYCPNMEYIIVGELHNGPKSECKCSSCGCIHHNYNSECPSCGSTLKSYAWHFHGLFSKVDNLPMAQAVDKDDKLKFNHYTEKVFDKDVKFIDGVLCDDISWLGLEDKWTPAKPNAIIQGMQPIFNLPSYKYGFTTATKVRDSSRSSYYILKYITKDMATLTKGKKRYFVSKNLARPAVSYDFVNSEEKDTLLIDLYEKCTYSKEIDFNFGAYNQHINLFQFDDYDYTVICEEEEVIEEVVEEVVEEVIEEDSDDEVSFVLPKIEEDYNHIQALLQSITNGFHHYYDDKNDEDILRIRKSLHKRVFDLAGIFKEVHGITYQEYASKVI